VDSKEDEFDVDEDESIFFPNYERIEGKNGWVQKLKEENAEQESS